MKKLTSLLKPFIYLKNWFFKKNLYIRIVLVTIFIAGLWFSYKTFFTNSKNTVSYQTEKVERGTLVVSVAASGTVLSSNYVNVTTQTNGVVKEVYVKDGDSVVEGQKIAEITPDKDGQKAQSQAWSSYLSAKNSLESAQANMYSLQSDMFSKWDSFMTIAQNSTYENSDKTPNYINRALPEFHISEDNWLAAEAKYKNQQSVISQAQASVASAWQAYQLTSPTITAPSTGVITNITIVPGMLISSSSSSDASVVSSQRVGVIKSDGKQIITLNLTEIDIPTIKPGQKATVTFDSIKDKTFTGTVATVDRIGSVSSGVTNYPVTVQLDLQDNRLLPNMSATANIVTDTRDNVLLVSSSAVKSSTQGYYVQVMQNNKPTSTQVEIGSTSDTQTEIKSGLKEGQTVITTTSTNTSSSSGTRTSAFSLFGTGGGNRFR